MEEDTTLLFVDSWWIVSSQILVHCTDGIKDSTMHQKPIAQGLVKPCLDRRWQQRFIDVMKQVVMLVDCKLVQIIDFRIKQLQSGQLNLHT
jgi:predicted protein tyrosine phosphatase